jgi:prolyl-tRNA editing enzyme YbaK/EbsC (Cys-tRNA(Pro) deacylase)
MADSFSRYQALERPDLLARPVHDVLSRWVGRSLATDFNVIEIDPDYSDTEAFCQYYGIAPDQTANTVIVEAQRAGARKLAVVIMLAADRADLNGAVRKLLEARRVSLAPKDTAVNESRMEYGSITAIGLPLEWPVLVDSRVLDVPALVMGGGLRKSKLLFPGYALADLPTARVIDGLARNEPVIEP